jgi:hypothetical protein
MQGIPKCLYSGVPNDSNPFAAYTSTSVGGTALKKIVIHNHNSADITATLFFGRGAGNTASTNNRSYYRVIRSGDTVEWSDPTYLNKDDTLWVMTSLPGGLLFDVWGIEVS